ncbi:MAG: hypothetical protein IID30_14755 [Planctomycetes bacterium]|nr:hypothetical protein [Planctomycetota bacterium]MCH7602448.1 hypothetical protein [Planctomycetota bacterium]
MVIFTWPGFKVGFFGLTVFFFFSTVGVGAFFSVTFFFTFELDPFDLEADFFLVTVFFFEIRVVVFFPVEADFFGLVLSFFVVDADFLDADDFRVEAVFLADVLVVFFLATASPFKPGCVHKSMVAMSL